METSKSINPATGETIAEYPRISDKVAGERVAKAKKAFEGWKGTSFADRADLMHRLSEVLETHQEKYAQLATKEMGKTIDQARKEIEKCGWICRYYADHIDSLLGNKVIETEANKSYVTFQPVGVILAVMPWNFPFYQVIRFAVPAIMAGNTGVLKHASNVQGCAFEIEEAFIEAGFPEGVFSNLNLGARQV